MAVKYTTHHAGHADINYQGGKPKIHSKADCLPVIDEVEGHGSPAPDPVKGHAGRLLSEKEARKL